MVIDNFNFDRSCLGPAKTDAPLVVDPDGMLPSAFSPKRLEAVTGRGHEIAQRVGRVELDELTQCNPGDRCKAPGLFLLPKPSGFGVSKRLDHTPA